MNKFSVCFLLMLLVVSGCSRDMNDLDTYISDVKAKKSGEIEPLPTIKEHPKHTYQSTLLRSPFAPDENAEAAFVLERESKSGVKKDKNRNKEFLEQFSMSSLKMVGTINVKGIEHALIQTSDKLIHQVTEGNYMGENDGRVVKITEASIEIREIVPDGIDGYKYRPSEIELADAGDVSSN